VQIIHGTRNLKTPFSASVLTIGNFDGVHLGHQELLKRVHERAQKQHIPSVVMTFEPHPIKVLYPDRGLKRVFDLEDLYESIARAGIDYLVIEPFSREFSQLPPERYLVEWIYQPFMPQLVIVGYDFSFGANRGGSIEFLKEQAKHLNFAVEVVPPVKTGEILVSSTRIRQAVEQGDVKLAAELLGRRFYVSGIVERGAGRGRTIGIPTANIRSAAETVPARGVYAAIATVHGTRYAAAVNIGLNPTFTDGQVMPQSIEAHLLNVPVDEFNIYGEAIRIEFIDRLRDEKKFSSVQELVTQIKVDIMSAEKIAGKLVRGADDNAMG